MSATASSSATPSATATWAIRPWFLAYLYGNTYSTVVGTYTYSVRPFISAAQVRVPALKLSGVKLLVHTALYCMH